MTSAVYYRRNSTYKRSRMRLVGEKSRKRKKQQSLQMNALASPLSSRVVMGLRPISANLIWETSKSEKMLVFGSPSHHKIVILSGAPYRWIVVPQGLAARSRRTSTLLICPCFRGFSATAARLRICASNLKITKTFGPQSCAHHPKFKDLIQAR
jgi:hypothetical protein